MPSTTYKISSDSQLDKPMVEGSFLSEIVSGQKRTICLLQQ